MADITINDLTLTTLDGTGVFDVLMRATKAHLDSEFEKNRIRGPEYSTVYLGSLESVMRTSLEFLLQNQRIALEAQLLEQQVTLAQVEVQKANAELLIVQANLDKIPLEIAHLGAQTTLVGQQYNNLVAEKLNIPKQGEVIDAQKAQIAQQTLNLVSEELGIDARTSLTNKQADNAVIEGTVLTAQQCKLAAEFDNLILQKNRVTAETALLIQKNATEKAQTTALGVDADSILGRQKGLYQAQTEGFARDAEQKAAKLLAETWNVRRTTDEGTVADGTNMLSDAVIGRAINKMLAGVGA